MQLFRSVLLLHYKAGYHRLASRSGIERHRQDIYFFCGEGSRSRSYGRTAALRLIVQPCDEDEEKDD